MIRTRFYYACSDQSTWCIGLLLWTVWSLNVQGPRQRANSTNDFSKRVFTSRHHAMWAFHHASMSIWWTLVFLAGKSDMQKRVHYIQGKATMISLVPLIYKQLQLTIKSSAQNLYHTRIEDKAFTYIGRQAISILSHANYILNLYIFQKMWWSFDYPTLLHGG